MIQETKMIDLSLILKRNTLHTFCSTLFLRYYIQKLNLSDSEGQNGSLVWHQYGRSRAIIKRKMDLFLGLDKAAI
jgi:hypothetical protein